MIEDGAHNAQHAGRVLVVDDEPVNRELIRDTLEYRGHAVEEAGSGVEALERIFANPPDLVLLDVAMPGLDGLEVCRKLKGDPATARIPVIMITAHVDRRDRLAGIDAGADDYLTKPVDLSDLVLRVRNSLFAKRLADDMEKSLRRLKELEQLRQNLTHMIIHDLRSPLSAVMMGLEMLKITATGPARERDLKLVDASFTSALRMSEMVTSLLDVSRLEAGEMPLQKTVIELGPVVREVIASIGPLALARQINLHGPLEDARALCDVDLIRRVLTNLITNAVKFTPAHGQVQVALFTEGARVRVTVKDSGPGIAPEHHRRIFEKFGQVEDRNARLGTGLGLTFCKLAIEAHGGQIGVASEPGRGSAFWFWLDQNGA